MFIHAHIKPKRKKSKPTAQQRQLAAEWNDIVKKYEPKKKVNTNVSAWTGTKMYVRETPKIPSLNTGNVAATKAEPKVYTGTKVLGIATMHKSNAVPVFNDKEAVEISSMRR
jgi:hypothetical protein